MKNNTKRKSIIRKTFICFSSLAGIVLLTIIFFDPYIARLGMWTVVQRNKIAAERGDIGAMHRLADLYSIGYYMKRDLPEAVKWTRRAAELDDAEAQYNLGCYYDTGDGYRH